MRIFLLCGMTAAIGLLLLQSYRLVREYRNTEREYDGILEKITPLAAENAALQANLKALEAGHGAERALHNAGYAAHGEKMIIIVPKE